VDDRFDVVPVRIEDERRVIPRRAKWSMSGSDEGGDTRST